LQRLSAGSTAWWPTGHTRTLILEIRCVTSRDVVVIAATNPLSAQTRCRRPLSAFPLSASLRRRQPDDDSQRTFSYFGTLLYWQKELQNLREQIARIDQHVFG
jgi:hypothetical protein